MVLADQALASGMIDSIGVPVNQSTATAAAKTEVRSMDLAQLKTEHPAVYDAAVAIGRDEERDRVGAHLKMAEASGDMDTAVTAIADGSGMTATLLATYSAASMNRNAVAARTEDNEELDTELEPQGASTFADRVAKEMDKLEGDKEGILNV
jgi:hypothetical protein